MPPPTRIPSGLEAIDRLLGGLQNGQLYLAHGDEVGRSLFGVRFLIEGLKRGEQGALVIGYSSEEAVNRFAQADYDCIEDVYSSRLVILEYSSEIIRKGMRPRHFASALRDLEWLLGEARPRRLVFDTVTQLMTGEEGTLQQRVSEFADWVRSFGATVVLVADETHKEVVQHFRPLVDNSFRFEPIENRESTVQRLIFEKSPDLADQAVNLVPSRSPQPRTPPAPQAQPPAEETPPEAGESGAEPRTDKESVTGMSLLLEDVAEEQIADEREGSRSRVGAPVTERAAGQPRATELINQDFPLDLDDILPRSRVEERREREARTAEPPAPEAARVTPAKVAESLLHPPGADTEAEMADESFAASAQARPSSGIEETISPKDCRVLIVDQDPASRKRISQALSEYTITVAQDGVSGLAGIISSDPDLVILSTDLPGINGFKVLAHIRANFAMPVMLVSGSHARASDRVLAAELGADYYLTKPLNVKELRQKARQLIARHRGITSWIILPHAEPPHDAEDDHQETHAHAADLRSQPVGSQLKPYPEFAALVEASVRDALEHGSMFTIIGCRMPQALAAATREQMQFLEVMRSLVRDTDALSTNPQQDVLVLLTDADPEGAAACISRLRQRLQEEFAEETAFWMRSFPKSEEDHNGGNGDHAWHSLTRFARNNIQ
ncbi:MAG TPA: response regulator [Blastocatellia bacterium]|nr:response regulator [Blastocatellia bacterium]